MKEAEIAKTPTCAICKKPILNELLFIVVRAQRYGWNLKALQRRRGLAEVLGGGSAGDTLAMVMGPDESLATKVDEVTCAIHDSCADQLGDLRRIFEE